MEIRFSVITVVLNDLAGLKKTRESLLAQTYKDFEWIVQDGGSKDGTAGFLESLGGDIKWVSQKDRGIYDAMNHGVSMASGDFVVFMNAGDVFFDNQTLARAAASVDQVTDILFGGAILSFPASGKNVYRPPRTSESSLWHGLPANHQATYYRRKLLEDTPYDLNYPLCGDYYLAAALMKNGAQASYLDSPLATFEVGGQSYRRLRQLFSEPYRIQRDVLGSPLHCRVASMAKRLVSTLGFMLLSQRVFGRGVTRAQRRDA